MTDFGIRLEPFLKLIQTHYDAVVAGAAAVLVLFITYIIVDNLRYFFRRRIQRLSVKKPKKVILKKKERKAVADLIDGVYEKQFSEKTELYDPHQMK